MRTAGVRCTDNTGTRFLSWNHAGYRLEESPARDDHTKAEPQGLPSTWPKAEATPSLGVLVVYEWAVLAQWMA